MRTYIEDIEDALASPRKKVVDLIDVDFGQGTVYRWSDRNVPGRFSFNGYEYTPRIQPGSVSQPTRRAGFSDDTLKLKLGNADGKISELFEDPHTEFEGAKVSMHRLFPDLTPDVSDLANSNAIQTYWFGRGKKLTINEDWSEWELSFGFSSLLQRGLRRYQASCPHVFGGALDVPTADCPYNRHLGGTIGILDIGGKPFTRCGGTEDECRQRGMYGPNGQQTDAVLTAGGYTGGQHRRWFGAPGNPAVTAIMGRQPDSGDRFTRWTQGNATIMDKPIPVVFGNYRIGAADPLAQVIDAGQYTHGLYVLSEGAISWVGDPQWNGQGPDNGASSFRVWGALQMVYEPDGSGSWKFRTGSGDTDLTLEQVMGACGSRRALYGPPNASGLTRTTGFVGQLVDTYADNPQFYNDSSGEGVSLSGLAIAFVRFQTAKNVAAGGGVAFQLAGIWTLVPNTDSTAALAWQIFSRATPFDAGYHFLRNARYGGGEVDANIDVQSVIDNVAICNETVRSAQGQTVSFSGSVSQGPTESTSDTNNVTFFSTATALPSNIGNNPIPTGYLSGGGITFNQGTIKEFSTYIQLNTYVAAAQDEDFRRAGLSLFVPTALENLPGNIITLRDPFPAGKVPAAGDPFIITGLGESVTRYKMNGIVADDLSVGQHLDNILKNGDGTIVQSIGKIKFTMWRAMTAAEKAVVDALPILTDYGASRNILRKDGISTLKVYSEPDSKIPNAVQVQFSDIELNYASSQIEVFDEVAQTRAARFYGETGKRRKVSETLVLNGTTSRDQAARLGTQYLRRRLQMNLFYEFEMGLKDAAKLDPMDIRRISSKLIPNWAGQYCRILEITESSKFTSSIKAQVHIDAYFDDYSGDFSRPSFPAGAETDPNAIPRDVLLTSITEVDSNTGDGVKKPRLRITLKWK